MLTVNHCVGDSPRSRALAPTLTSRCAHKSNVFLCLHSHCDCSLKSLVIHVLFLKYFSTAGLVCLFQVKYRFVASGCNCTRLNAEECAASSFNTSWEWKEIISTLNDSIHKLKANDDQSMQLGFESNITIELRFVFTCLYACHPHTLGRPLLS